MQYLVHANFLVTMLWSNELKIASPWAENGIYDYLSLEDNWESFKYIFTLFKFQKSFDSAFITLTVTIYKPQMEPSVKADNVLNKQIVVD